MVQVRQENQSANLENHKRADTSTVRERGSVCMACCRAALIARLTVGLALALGIAQCLSASSQSEDPSSQDLSLYLRQRAGRLLLSEGAKAAAAAATTRGMTATSVTTVGSSAASALGSAAASVAVASRRASGGGWLRSSSSGGGKRRGADRGSNWSSASAKSAGTGVGEGRRALSLLSTAVAPRAGTSALFVVSAAGSAGGRSPPRPRETFLSEAGRARCRCVWCLRALCGR